MNGFIYIMSNPAFKDGLVKIGISKTDPSQKRVHELYSTEVPQPYKVQYTAFVQNYLSVEKKVHRILSKERPNKNREFFRVSVPKAILTIQENAQIKRQADNR